MGLISRVSSRTYRSTILDMDKKNKQMLKNQSQPKITHHAIPDEARVMKQILEELGITDYDPQVVTQMLDFSYGYLTEVLSDSQAFAKHRDCGAIDIEDVKLATKNKQERSKRGSSLLPSRSTVSKVASKRNEKPLDYPKATDTCHQCDSVIMKKIMKWKPCLLRILDSHRRHNNSRL